MELTKKHAEFVGLHFGDGSLIVRSGTKRLRFQLRGDANISYKKYKKNNNSKSKLHKVGVILITSYSKSLIYDASTLLTRLKIKNYAIDEKPNRWGKLWYRVKIYPPHVSEFFNIIGSHNPKHITKYMIAERFGFCPPHTTLAERQQILKGELSALSI